MLVINLWCVIFVCLNLAVTSNSEQVIVDLTITFYTLTTNAQMDYLHLVAVFISECTSYGDR